MSSAYAESLDTLKNTIVAGGIIPAGTGGSGPDLYGQYFVSQGTNLIQDMSPSYSFIGGLFGNDIRGTDPKLLPLGEYGGPTPTMLPLPNSAAINTGDAGLTAAQTDQRGSSRNVGGRPDIGAVEANYTIAASSGTPQASQINKPFALPRQCTVNENGKPVTGVAVIFIAPTVAGASGTFSNGKTNDTAITGATGIATSKVFTANSSMGSYVVAATIGTTFGSTTFTLENTKQLAVVFGNVTAMVNNCTVQINWQTLTAEGGESFTVERSTNSVDFSTVHTTASTGASNQSQQYNYTDLSPAGGANYYRVKQTDANNTVIYSNTILAVNTCGSAPVIAYPNPVHNTLTLVIPGAGKHTVKVFDAHGRLVTSQIAATGTINIDASNWAGGVYSVVVYRNGKNVYTIKIVKD